MRTKEFVKFILAREAHRAMREAGEDPKAWRNRKRADPIISMYRFCNVRREDDRVTRWIADNIRTPLAEEQDLWFALTVARLFNLPESLSLILPHLLPWRPEKVRTALRQHKDNGGKVFNAAYIVSTNGLAMDKVDYVLDHVLAPMWSARARIRTVISCGATLAQIHTVLQQQRGLGSFMAAQVVADLKYVEPWRSAMDWKTFAAMGPGSKRGLNRIMGRPADAPYRPIAWNEDIQALHRATVKLLPHTLGAGLHCQDVQNCLCEFDKYERVRTGEGRPKQLYTPSKEN